jgi:hypothetical protein
MHTKFFMESLKGRDHLADQGEDGGVIYKWILRKYDRRVWIGFI